jgi:6-phosphogluconolactonase
MATSTEVKIFTKPKKVSKRVAREIRQLILESGRKRFNIALSGGNTPKKLFKTLVKKHHDSIPWDRVHFWWGDERCVAPDSEESNFRLASENLFQKIPIPAKNIHRIKGENNPESEAERYSGELVKQIDRKEDIPVFDLILLGLGDDGHIASIFPDQLFLFHSENLCVVAEHPLTGQKRVTLTGKVINNAKNIFFLVTGEGKAKRIAEIMNNEKVARKHPAYFVEPRNGLLTWFLDEAAASKIN